MRQADKNSPPKKVVPISKMQPYSNKKQQQNVKLNGRFIIDTNATNSIISKELPPENTKRAEGAIKALNSALNQSSLTFFQQKRQISSNVNNQTVIHPPSTNLKPNSRDNSINNATDPLIDTKIPQVTYLAETSSLGSGSRIMAAPATSTKQPALILQPTGNEIPPPSTAPLANSNINLPFSESNNNNAKQDDKMIITTTTMFQRSKQLSKTDQLQPQTRRSQRSFIQSKFLNTQNQPVVQQATTEEAQKLMISASDENIVQGLEPGEHYIKLMPNDYWEFYKQHIQSFKKHDHGIKQPRRSLLAPANRTAIPLDLAKVQNTAFKKMMPKNDSDATIQFQKQFLWNQQAEDRKRQRDQQKLAALIDSSDQSIKKQQSDLASFKQQSLSANQSQKSKPFKTSKFPITQNLEMHPEVLVSADKVSYLRFQDQIGPYGDPKRMIGSPGKASRGMAQTLANWNVGQRLATSNHTERLRTAVTSQMKMQNQSRTNSPLMRQRMPVNEDTIKAKPDRTGSSGFGEANPFEQERQYMKDWMLGRMYTRIEWVMQEADQRCKCCNRIHCLNKKKSRDAIYQGRRNISQHVAKEHSPLLSPKTDEKITINKLNNPRDIISATSGSNSRSIPFTPVSIQNAMIRAQGYQQQLHYLKGQGESDTKNVKQSSQQLKKEETDKKTSKISSYSLNSRMIQVNPQQLAPFSNEIRTQQLPNERGTPSIFSPNGVTPGLVEIKQKNENNLQTAGQSSSSLHADNQKQDSSLQNVVNQQNQNMISLKSMEYDLLHIQPKLLPKQEDDQNDEANKLKLDNISSITPISEQPLLMPVGMQDSQSIQRMRRMSNSIHTSQQVQRQHSGFLEQNFFDNQTGDFPVIVNNISSGTSAYRNTMYEKAAVSLPWVSPYKAHQIKKEFKLTKVAAKITKNMENQGTLPDAVNLNRGNKFQLLLKNHQLLGEGVSLYPSTFMNNKDLQNDPQEYRQKSTQGRRAHFIQQTTLPELVGASKGAIQRNQFFQRSGFSTDNIVSQRTHPEQNQYLNATIKQIMEQEKFDKGSSSPKKLVGTQLSSNRVVRWQDQIEEGEAQVRVGTANKTSMEGGGEVRPKNFMMMDSIQEEQRKMKKKKIKGSIPASTRYAEKLQSSGIYSNSTGSTALRVFDMNKSLIQDRSLLKEQIKLAIRRPSPDNLFKIKASKTAVGFFKGQGTRKIIGGAIPRKPNKKQQDQKVMDKTADTIRQQL